MPRRFSLLISIAVLALAGYLAWRLAYGDPRPAVVPPVGTPDSESRPVPGRAPDTRADPVFPDVAQPAPPSREDRIEGVVSDGSGRPVADADVQVIQLPYDPASTRPLDRRFTERVDMATVSGADGRFAFADLTPGEVKILRASKAGFVTQLKNDVRVPKTVEFHMTPGAYVRGRVVNARTREPIERVGIKGFFPAGARGQAATGRGFYWSEEVFTNRAGEFSFEGAPSGVVLFRLAHPEYQDVSREAVVALDSRNDVDFEMKPALVIEGVVVHAAKGTPVAGAAVEAFDTFPLAIAARWTAKTADDGTFRMKGVKSGPVVFKLSRRGFTPLHASHELSERNDFAARPGDRVEFRIQPAGRAVGRVVDLKREPIAGARVFVVPVETIFQMVRDPAGHGGSIKDGEGRTNQAGEFLVDDLTAVPHRVVAEAPGFALGASEAFQVGPDELKENVEIVLRPAPIVRGMVSDEIRAPVPGAVVTVELPQYPEAWFPQPFGLGQKGRLEATTDAHGVYRLELPYTGTFTLGPDHPAFVAVEPVSLEIGPADGDVVRDFTLKPAFSISGTVTSPAGEGFAGAMVRAWTQPSSGTPREVRSGADGKYELSRLESGLYRVHAKVAEPALTSDFRDDVPAGSEGVDFRLTAGGTVAGSVTDRAGTPVADFRVHLRPAFRRTIVRGQEKKPLSAGLSEREEHVRDPGGTFRIGGVDPGSWTVQVVSGEHAPSALVEIPVTNGAVASVGTIVLAAGGVVSGKVSAPGGAPAEGVSILLTRTGDLPDQNAGIVVPPKPWSARSGPTGEYAIGGLPAGEYIFFAESQGFVDPPHERISVREGALVERSFTLRAAATVTLVVKDEVSQPVLSARLMNVIDSAGRKVNLKSDGAGSPTTTDQAGRLTLKGIPAGEALTLKLMKPGFQIVDVPVTLKEGDNGDLDVRLHRLL